MTLKWLRMALAGLDLALLARSAQANPSPMYYNPRSTGIILMAFLGWLAIGGILRLAELDLMYFGITGLIQKILPSHNHAKPYQRLPYQPGRRGKQNLRAAFFLIIVFRSITITITNHEHEHGK